MKVFDSHHMACRYTEVRVCPTMVTHWGTGGGHIPMVAEDTGGIRRLTPVEAERLMGFEDNYTLITYRGKPAADTPRYRALGNSIAVPCLRWIGERLQKVDKLCMEKLSNTRTGIRKM